MAAHDAPLPLDVLLDGLSDSAFCARTGISRALVKKLRGGVLPPAHVVRRLSLRLSKFFGFAPDVIRGLLLSTVAQARARQAKP